MGGNEHRPEAEEDLYDVFLTYSIFESSLLHSLLYVFRVSLAMFSPRLICTSPGWCHRNLYLVCGGVGGGNGVINGFCKGTNKGFSL